MAIGDIYNEGLALRLFVLGDNLMFRYMEDIWAIKPPCFHEYRYQNSNNWVIQIEHLKKYGKLQSKLNVIAK